MWYNVLLRSGLDFMLFYCLQDGKTANYQSLHHALESKPLYYIHLTPYWEQVVVERHLQEEASLNKEDIQWPNHH